MGNAAVRWTQDRGWLDADDNPVVETTAEATKDTRERKPAAKKTDVREDKDKQ